MAPHNRNRSKPPAQQQQQPQQPQQPQTPVVACGELNEHDKAFLKSLAECEFQAIDEFDKKVFTLASGAFGVSFVFLKDIVTPGNIIDKPLLICAWILWSVTLTLNLTSFYCSHLAMRGAQRKYHAGERDENKLRGFAGNAVMWLNPITGVLFITGLICMSVFVTSNLYGTRNPKTTATSTTANSAPATTATNAATATAPKQNSEPSAPTGTGPTSSPATTR